MFNIIQKTNPVLADLSAGYIFYVNDLFAKISKQISKKVY
jgi:hypothetical protein